MIHQIFLGAVMRLWQTTGSFDRMEEISGMIVRFFR